MHPGGVWYGKGAGHVAARAALWPISVLYALGWRAYLATYQLGLNKPTAPHTPIVCVGNLQVGGSGKTPTVLHVAKVLRELGRDVVLSVSGYGAPHAQGASLAPEGILDAKSWGDEPAMLRWLSPGLPLIVGRDRVLAARICQDHFPDFVLLMDDGFQHLPLRKHVSVLLDEPNPQNGLCLPAGPFREPRSGRNRADLVIPGKFELKASLSGFLGANEASRSTKEASGTKVAVLCAIGNPGRFVEGVRLAGLEVVQSVFLQDHEPMDAGNLLSRFEAGLPIVVTAKDWVKLRERADAADREFWIADYDLRIEPASQFRDWLFESLKREKEAA